MTRYTSGQWAHAPRKRRAARLVHNVVLALCALVLAGVLAYIALLPEAVASAAAVAGCFESGC